MRWIVAKPALERGVRLIVAAAVPNPDAVAVIAGVSAACVANSYVAKENEYNSIPARAWSAAQPARIPRCANRFALSL